MKEWGSANKTDVEYVVVENSQFPQKLAAAVEAKAPPDVVMLTSGASVLDYAGRDLLADVTDVWNDVSKQAGGFWKYVEPVYRSQLLFRYPVRGRHLTPLCSTRPDRKGDGEARAAQDF
jgi:hypothetical protein